MKNKIVTKYMTSDCFYAGIVLVIGIVAMTGLEIYVSKTTAISYPIELWIESSRVIDFFFPLIVTLPFTWQLYHKKKDGFLKYVSVRTNCSKYVLKTVAISLGKIFLMVLLLYYTGIVIAVTLIRPENITADNILERYVFGIVQMNYPLIFGLGWCIWKGIVGIVIATFGYAVALVVDNVFIVSLLPFLYCILENFVTGTLHLEKYSVCTTYILNRLSPYSMRWYYYFVGVVSFIIITAFIVFLCWIHRKWVVIDEKYN